MNILILDDLDTRLNSFKRKFIGHSVTTTKTAKEAIAQLKAAKYDVLYLDHDLGYPEGEGFVPKANIYDKNGHTGYTVACWLEENEDKKPDNIILHSLNPSGVKRMKQALPEAKVQPFAWQ